MKKKLYKSLLGFAILLIAFFSMFINSNAASFKYKDFNWEEFLEQHKGYWTSKCDEGDENCYDSTIKTQERFYKRLYKLLARYQAKGYTIDDNIIIETVFYGLTPDTFNDPEGEEDDPFNLGADDDFSFIAEITDQSSAKAYFEKETDSLVTLMNNMIGYTQVCYGISNIKPTTNDDGETVCNGSNLQVSGDECIAKVDVLESSFFASIGLPMFNDSNNDEQCKEMASAYAGYRLGEVSTKKEVNEELYWNFLENSDYFDKKDHLQSYFSRVLRLTGHEKMSELTLEEYMKYEEDIIKNRTTIINNIKAILKSFSKYASNVSMTSGNLSTYWWPIGSSETTESDGIVMASGVPESLTITSEYGLRTDPVTGAANSKHNGVDISGIEGSTNVIAARDGTVVFVVDENGGNCVNGDISCGGAYGNYLIIQHIDNNYTLYAHLAPGTITVKSGDVVKQGQVIGKVGNTGKSTGPHLHFEVRVGGNDLNSTQNPLLFVDANNPRAIAIQSDLMEWIGAMEGTGPMEGDNYVVYNDSGGVATFGHGITVKNNPDLISSFGIDPSSLTVGSLVPKSTADEMYASLVQNAMDSIKAKTSSKGITLTEYQIGALVSLNYNTGNINPFYENYNTYGPSESLCTNWWENYALHDANGNYLEGLKKRRIAECDAFVNGTYNMNVYG